MNLYLDKKEKILIWAMVLSCILVPPVALATIGYFLGLQRTDLLGGDLRIEEVAQFTAVLFGGSGCLIGVVIAIAYGFYAFSKIEASGNR